MNKPCQVCLYLQDALSVAREQRIHAEQLALTHGSTRLIDSFRSTSAAFEAAKREYDAHKMTCQGVTA